MSTVVEVLRRGRELYASAPSHVADPEEPTHGTYCPLTATEKAAIQASVYDPEGDSWLSTMRRADEALWKAAGTMRLVKWNAENSTEVVLEAWDRAIAAAEAKT